MTTSTLSYGEQLIAARWCIAEMIGETHLLLAKGRDRILYDCAEDELRGTIQAEEEWNPEWKPTEVSPMKYNL